MPSLEKTSSQIEERGPVVGLAQAAEGGVHLAADAARLRSPNRVSLRRRSSSTHGSSADGPSSSGESAAVAAVVPW